MFVARRMASPLGSPGSACPTMTAVASACCCSCNAIPSSAALALLSTRALRWPNAICWDVGPGGAVGASTVTVAAELLLRLRSSVAVAVTVTGPGPSEAVSSTAELSRGVTLPALVPNASCTGRLSGLNAWQVTVEISPLCTLVGDAVQLMVGGAAATGVGGGGGGGGSNISTLSPVMMSCNANVIIAVALLGVTFITIMSPSTRRGSSPSLLRAKCGGLFCVSSVVVAKYEMRSV